MAVYWAISEQTFNTHDTSALVGATSVWAAHKKKNRKIVQYEVKFKEFLTFSIEYCTKIGAKKRIIFILIFREVSCKAFIYKNYTWHNWVIFHLLLEQCICYMFFCLLSSFHLQYSDNYFWISVSYTIFMWTNKITSAVLNHVIKHLLGHTAALDIQLIFSSAQYQYWAILMFNEWTSTA